MDKIGLIAGAGKFPFLFSHAAKQQGIFVVAFAFKKITDKRLKKYVDRIFWLDIGRLGELLEALKQNRIKKAVMAGKIPKAFLFNSHLEKDEESNSFLNKVSDKGDASLLTAVADKLKQQGVQLLDSTTFLSHLLPSKGTFTRREPSDLEWEDIHFGKELAKRMGDLDIGQTVLVKNKVVLAIEAIEGTDVAIKRGGKLGNRGAVAVKMSRPVQDMRFDVPVVGPETVRTLIKAKFAVLAVEAKKSIIIDREEVVKLANRKGIAIVAV